MLIANSPLGEDRICLSCAHTSLYVISDMKIACQSCGKEYYILDGVPVLVEDIVEHQKLLDRASKEREAWYVKEQILPPQKNPYLYMQHVMESELTDLYRRHVGSGKEIFDIGCGDGRNRDFLKKMGRRVVATDYNMTRVNRANRGASQYDSLFMSNLLSLPLPDKYCQVIHFDQVLEHMPEPRKALAAIHRVLRDDGVLILCIPNEGCWYHQIKFKVNPGLLKRTDHVNFFTLKSITELLAECGFMIIDSRRIGWGLPVVPNGRFLGFIKKLEDIMRRRIWYNIIWEHAGRVFLPNQNFLLYMAVKKMALNT